MASKSLVTIDSDSGLVPIRHQAIDWTDGDILSMGNLGHTEVKFESKYLNFQTFIHEILPLFHTASFFEHTTSYWISLQWRHNGHDSVSNHQPHHCLLNCLFKRRSKKTSKLHVTGLCAGKSPGTGEFPAQMASNAEMPPFDDVIIGSTHDSPIAGGWS